MNQYGPSRANAGGGSEPGEAAAVCLADQGHGRLVQLRLTGEFQHTVELALPPVDEPMRRITVSCPDLRDSCPPRVLIEGMGDARG